MNRILHGVARAVAETFDLPEPLLEIGSYQVPGQEHVADLRSLFAGKEYLGIDARPGPAPRPPDLTVTAELDTLAAMASGDLLASEALATGAVTVEGDEGARIRSLQILAPAALGVPAAI